MLRQSSSSGTVVETWIVVSSERRSRVRVVLSAVRRNSFRAPDPHRKGRGNWRREDNRPASPRADAPRYFRPPTEYAPGPGQRHRHGDDRSERKLEYPARP